MYKEIKETQEKKAKQVLEEIKVYMDLWVKKEI